MYVVQTIHLKFACVFTIKFHGRCSPQALRFVFQPCAKAQRSAVRRAIKGSSHRQRCEVDSSGNTAYAPDISHLALPCGVERNDSKNLTHVRCLWALSLSWAVVLALFVVRGVLRRHSVSHFHPSTYRQWEATTAVRDVPGNENIPDSSIVRETPLARSSLERPTDLCRTALPSLLAGKRSREFFERIPLYRLLFHQWPLVRTLTMSHHLDISIHLFIVETLHEPNDRMLYL